MENNLTERSLAMTAENITIGYCVKEPRLSRFWGALGFGRATARPPEDFKPEGMAEGYFITAVVTHWDLLDRLRILISGRTNTEVAVITDVQIGKRFSFGVSGVLKPTDDGRP
jgi:hypothetical protein